MSHPESTEPDLPRTEPQTAEKELDFSGKEDQLLSCPKCKHFISGSDINIEKTIARCGHCNHVFGFSHDSHTGLLRPELLIPEGVETLKLRSELDIRLNWQKTTSKGGRGFMTLFTFAWNLILLPFVLMIVLSGNWGILLFISLHLAVGLGLLWYTAAIYLNRTVLSINSRRLKVRSLPVRLPTSRTKEMDVRDIDQLYVSKYTASTTNGVPNYAYALYAVMKDGSKVSLLRGMNKETQRYIEQEIEGFLSIKNESVDGEDGR
jgi:hypothetical protein